MLFETIAALLSDPVYGEMEEVDQWDRWKRLNEEASLHGKPMSSHGAIIRADAALLAVANARGTCGACKFDLDYPISCRGDVGRPLGFSRNIFGCSLWEAKQP